MDDLDEEATTCHLCPTTEREQGKKLVYVEWMQGEICSECAHFFGIGDDDATQANRS